MYQHDYEQAELLLKDVVNNGFYALNAESYNDRETITNLYNNSGSNSEIIFATKSIWVAEADPHWDLDN